MDENIGVMSVGFLLPSPDDAVIWRGPKKHSMYYVNGLCFNDMIASNMFREYL